MQLNEHEIEQLAIRGDEEALTTLLERHAPEVRRMLSRGPGAVPVRWQHLFTLDDVMQQAYLDAFLGIRSYRPQVSNNSGAGSFAGWLYTLARHNLLDTIKHLEAEKRGGGRRRLTPGTSADADESFVTLFEWLGGVTSTPSRVAARTEAKDALTRAIEMLPDDYRRVVEEYDLAGRSIEAVSASLGRSQGATYMLRARAHRLLSQLLGTASQYLSKVP